MGKASRRKKGSTKDKAKPGDERPYVMVVDPDRRLGIQVPDGYSMFYAAGGKLRVPVPSGWGITQREPFTRFRDRPQPDDRMLLDASVHPIPVATGLTPRGAVSMILARTERADRQGDLIELQRDDLQGYWLDSEFIEPHQNRPAFSRSLLVMGMVGVDRTKLPRDFVEPLGMLTFTFYPEDRAEADAIWRTILDHVALDVPAPLLTTLH